MIIAHRGNIVRAKHGTPWSGRVLKTWTDGVATCITAGHSENDDLTGYRNVRIADLVLVKAGPRSAAAIAASWRNPHGRA